MSCMKPHTRPPLWSLRGGPAVGRHGCCASLTQGRRTIPSLPPAPMNAQLGRLVSARPSAGGREGRDPQQVPARRWERAQTSPTPAATDAEAVALPSAGMAGSILRPARWRVRNGRAQKTPSHRYEAPRPPHSFTRRPPHSCTAPGDPCEHLSPLAVMRRGPRMIISPPTGMHIVGVTGMSFRNASRQRRESVRGHDRKPSRQPWRKTMPTGAFHAVCGTSHRQAALQVQIVSLIPHLMRAG